MRDQVRPPYSFWGTKNLVFFAENHQISYADHDSEGIIRRKTLLPLFYILRPK